MPQHRSCDELAGSVAREAAVPRSWKDRLCAATLGTLGFLLVYVLSAGPAAGLHKLVAFRWLRRAIELYFAPIVWLVRHGPRPIGELLKWYVDLFR